MPEAKATTKLIRPAKRSITVKVNGTVYEGLVEPRKLLSDFLREDLGFKGVHVGCEHGVCGACTILFNGDAVRSCLMFAVQADGAEIVTIEGISKDKLNDLQEAFRKHHGLQCGFCTPGQIISATDLLAKNPNITREEIKEGMSGNICRCTGYHGIINAVQETAENRRKENQSCGCKAIS